MRILSYLITKNEADRYLEQTVANLREHVDGLFVYDDRSTDHTPDILKDLGCEFMIRGTTESSFLEDESDFRHQAWDYMIKFLDPRHGDWILTLDADEMLRTSTPLKMICADAAQQDLGGLWMHVHEMWSPTEIRVDGYWPTIRAARLIEYMAQSAFRTFETHRFGGGSLPVFTGPVGTTTEAEILHYGYATQADREAKYQRYTGRAGHNRTHIDSILKTPMLALLPPLV